MKHLLLVFFLIGCTTVNRPDLKAPKGYEMKQDKLLGVIPLKPKAVAKPTAAQKTSAMIQKPAVWILYACLPIAILAFAASVVMQNPSLTRKLVSVAAIAFLAAVMAGVWMYVSMSIIAFAAFAVIVGAVVYFKFEGKGLRWQGKESQHA